jgi:predicted dehydrogenase
MKTFNWAVIGPGRIAHRFAEALNLTDNTAIRCVVGRDLDRALAFSQQWSRAGYAPACATTNMDDVLTATDIDCVYIATPHAFHADAIRQCLQAGKAVLCEKPLVTDAATARELISLARERQIFLMEAVWTRFLPIYAQVGAWLQAGAIGRVQAMQSSFCFNAPYDARSRVFDPLQAGGALLDIGIYNLTITRWVMAEAFGVCPMANNIAANAVIGPTGVDHRLAATLNFTNGVTSQFVCSVESAGENTFHIIGDKGTINIHKYFSAAQTATLNRTNEDAITVSKPWRINGFEGEIDEAIRSINAGKIESDVMSHEETLKTLEWMDQIRRNVGVRYPFDR